MKANHKYLILLTALLGAVGILAWFVGVINFDKTPPTAKQGVLDLTEWNFEKDGPVQLNGEWEFYWSQLLSAEDFKENIGLEKLRTYQNVPKGWNQEQKSGIKLPGKGYATYRLKVKTDKGQKTLGFKLLTVSTAYRMMVNGKQAASSGKVGDSAQTSFPEYKTQAVSIPGAGGEFEIIIQVANYTYARGGLWRPITMGTDAEIRHLEDRSSRAEMFMFGVMAIMLCYHFSLYWIQKKNKSMLYAMLGLLVMAVRVIVTGEYYITSLIPDIPFRLIIILEYTTIYWGPVAWLLFIAELYQEDVSKPILRACICNSAVMTLITFITPVYFYTSLLTGIEAYSILVLGYSSVVVVQALKKRRNEAEILLFCVLLVFGAFIIEGLMLANNMKMKSASPLMIAVTAVVLLQAIIIAARYSRAFVEAEKYSKEMEHINELKDEFLANTSHELRTPLNGIINITQSVIKGAAGSLNDKQSENLGIVVSSAKKLYNLINDILDVSSIKNDEIKVYLKPINLGMMVEPILFVMENLKGEKEIVLNSSIPNDLPSIMCDEERLRQVFYNLLGNAIKFTEKGTIAVEARQVGNFVIISVSDTGIGMPKEKLEDIFNSFERIESSMNKRYEGSGLGLYITKRLVELQGGKIWVESKIGEGSSFSIKLPVSSKEPENTIDTVHTPLEKPVVSLEEFNEPVSGGSYTILAVDDDRANLKALSNHLRMEGYSVKCVENGYDAIEELKNGAKFDLVILDVMMPGISGYHVLEKIRKKYLPSELPVLLLTARNNQNDITAGFNKGANDYLTKPFEAEELVARVKNLVQFKQAIDRLVKTELAFLQAQIKPHFIFNALSVISSLTIRNPEKAKELVLDLSDYLRGSLEVESHNSLTALKKELDIVKAYLAIEQARFKDRFNVIFDIECDRDCSVPILSLQPLVENAVRHGIMPLAEGGKICIRIRDEGEYIRVSVSDNGKGIDEEEIQKLLQGDEVKKGSVGLKNINRRLIALYGTGLSMTNNEQGGATAEFVIPYQKKRS